MRPVRNMACSRSISPKEQVFEVERTVEEDEKDDASSRRVTPATSPADSGYGSEYSLTIDAAEVVENKEDNPKPSTIIDETTTQYNQTFVTFDYRDSPEIASDECPPSVYISSTHLKSPELIPSSPDTSVKQEAREDNTTSHPIMQPQVTLTATRSLRAGSDHHSRIYRNETIMVGPCASASSSNLLILMHKSCRSAFPVKCVSVPTESAAGNVRPETENWTATCPYCQQDVVIPGWIS